MNVSSIGATQQPAQPPAPAPQVDPAEEFQDSDGPVSSGSGAAVGSPVPGGSDARLSIDALTALQQPDTGVSTGNSDGGGSAASDHADSTGIADIATLVTGDADETATAPANVADTATRQDAAAEVEQQQARNDVPAGEETDSGGRSERNPLDLQV